AVAREINIPRVAVPRYPGTFSALGMLLSEWRQDFVQTFVAELAGVDVEEIDRQFAAMAEPGRIQLQKDGLSPERLVLTRSIDLRYGGQDHALPVPLKGLRLDSAGRTTLRWEFDALHEKHYGHASPGEPVEIVNLRLSMRVPRDQNLVASLLAGPQKTHTPAKRAEASRSVTFSDARGPQPAQVLWRHDLSAGDVITGPAVIEEENSTTLLHPGDVARINEAGIILIEVAPT